MLHTPQRAILLFAYGRANFVGQATRDEEALEKIDGSSESL